MRTRVDAGTAVIDNATPTNRTCTDFRGESGMNAHARAAPASRGMIIPPTATKNAPREFEAISAGRISMPARRISANMPIVATSSSFGPFAASPSHGIQSDSHATARASSIPATTSPTEAGRPIRSVPSPRARVVTSMMNKKNATSTMHTGRLHGFSERRSPTDISAPNREIRRNFACGSSSP